MTHLERTDTGVYVEKLDPPQDMLWDERWGIRKTVYGWLRLPSGQHQMIASPADWDALETALNPKRAAVVEAARALLELRSQPRSSATRMATLWEQLTAAVDALDGAS